MPTFTITDSDIGSSSNSGVVDLDFTNVMEEALNVTSFGTNEAGQVTIQGEAGLDDITTLNLTGIGGSQGAADADVITFDLSTFNDSFSIAVTTGSKAASSDDCIVFDGATSVTDLGSGNWEVAYSNGGVDYTIDVFAGDANVKPGGPVEPEICFDQGSVTGLIGLWEFKDGAETKDTGLADGLEQDGTFESGAGTSNGRAIFNGNDERFDVEGDNGGPLESEFDLDSGTIEVQFNQAVHQGSSVDTIVNRGEFNDRNTEGYFSISATENGAVEVVHIANGESVTLTTSDGFFAPGDDVNVKYTWDEAVGVKLTVTNGTETEVLTDDTTGLDLDIGDNDDEIFTFGARETTDGQYAQEFNGSIDYVAVYDQTCPSPLKLGH
jgi:hypothetical protein